MKKILIVDDKWDVRELITLSLELDNYNIMEAADPHTALKMIEDELPDLVLLDIMFPKESMDGIDICKKIKQNKATSEIKILIISAKGQQIDKEKGMECGAVEYITKPFSPAVLSQKVNALLSNETMIATSPPICEIVGSCPY